MNLTERIFLYDKKIKIYHSYFQCLKLFMVCKFDSENGLFRKIIKSGILSQFFKTYKAKFKALIFKIILITIKIGSKIPDCDKKKV